jgi:hypothetical protein
VTFPTPFQLKGMAEQMPAGIYEVATSEETIGDFMFEAYRRLSTPFICRRGPATMEWASSSRLILRNWRR